MRSRTLAAALVAAVVLVGCSDEDSAPAVDAAAIDATAIDATAIDAPAIDAPALARIEARVEYAGAEHGQLIVALFASVPPMGPPMAFARVTDPSFPATVAVEDLDAGTVYALALLDVAPASPSMPGPEDRSVWSQALTLSMGQTTSVTLTLVDP